MVPTFQTEVAPKPRICPISFSSPSVLKKYAFVIRLRRQLLFFGLRNLLFSRIKVMGYRNRAPHVSNLSENRYPSLPSHGSLRDPSLPSTTTDATMSDPTPRDVFFCRSQWCHHRLRHHLLHGVDGHLRFAFRSASSSLTAVASVFVPTLSSVPIRAGRTNNGPSPLAPTPSSSFHWTSLSKLPLDY